MVKREKKEAEGDAANKDDSEKEKVVKSDGGMQIEAMDGSNLREKGRGDALEK